jgi:hypothetical protein
MANRKSDAAVSEIPLPEFVDNVWDGHVSHTATSTLHICNATDGGVGKSTLARLLCEYYIKHKPDGFTLIDADPKLDVAIAYAPDLYGRWQHRTPSSSQFFELSAAAPQQPENDLLSEHILLSTDIAYTYLGDRLLELACSKDMILCQPSNNLDGLMAWLDDNKIDGRSDAQFKAISWWLSHGTKRGQDTFVEFVNKYPNLSHVFVLNQGVNSAVPNWNRFKLEQGVAELIGQNKVKFATLSRFRSDPAIVARVEQGEQFNKAIESLHPQIGIKVQNWLQSNWDSLKSTGLLL